MKNEIEFKFGDYAIIEQKRHGVPNEMFVHKVVGQLRSNTWVDVPVRVPATETLHGEMEDICLCICCGIDETKVRRYRVKDMRRHSPVSLVADEKSGSTITLQAVNELIASLESAGELSIREQKFLKLAKAFKQLAEENVALKALIPENWQMHDVLHQLIVARPGGVYFNKWEKLIAEVLNATTATDRIVAGIKADAIVEAAVELDRVDTVASTRVIGFKLREFSQQLREGADK
ncbi:TPA: hypothetical protein ACQ8OS_001747 [Klebsiella pneumoniae]|nr:hypothetical protein [Klebsiella pneumoniae]MDK7267352.1 hypothetical protein [Klebsiella pneumoniae]WRT31836.1 hypothetical protein VI619_09965 [Klebsiella pneumoniae]SBN30267.1 conserved hypothetical protein [Klebsiella pneumoniae]SYC51994.1 Uncharacterised protein [Klebsiella pneumoniae]SYI40376.1 Uncharacterised protein [Klebsiella pneumoniae]